ncbi:MAG: branched-chain amino acid ABC transporter permease [Chitinophagaceae bacterium]|nr:branched-chain amino acid ABC transporter permease [Rubrivivax sp.]
MATLPDYVLAVLLPQAFDGLIIASALILVAVGLTMIFGLLHVINLAHGELYMLGAYGAYALMGAGAPFWLALLASPLLVGTLGLLIERLGVRPLMRRKDRAVLTLLLTFGLGLMLRDAAQMLWGAETRSVAAPVSGASTWGQIAVSNYRLLLFGIALGVIVAVWWFVHRTMAGAVLRAAAHDPEMVSALGVPVARVQAMTFFACSALAALSGVLLAPIYAVFPGMGHDFILLAFAVVIVGGMGSVLGAVVAGVLLAQVHSLGSLVMRPAWAETLVFAVMIGVLVFRPHGLFGRAEGR